MEQKRGYWAYILLFIPTLITFAVYLFLYMADGFVASTFLWLSAFGFLSLLFLYLIVSKKGVTMASKSFLLIVLLFWLPTIIPILVTIFFLDLLSGL